MIAITTTIIDKMSLEWHKQSVQGHFSCIGWTRLKKRSNTALMERYPGSQDSKITTKIYHKRNLTQRYIGSQENSIVATSTQVRNRSKLNRIQGLYRVYWEKGRTLQVGALQGGDCWTFLPRDWTFYSLGCEQDPAVRAEYSVSGGCQLEVLYVAQQNYNTPLLFIIHKLSGHRKGCHVIIRLLPVESGHQSLFCELYLPK